MALASIDHLVLKSQKSALTECVAGRRDAGSWHVRRRVRAYGASPQFGQVPGTDGDLHCALSGDKEHNRNILVASGLVSRFLLPIPIILHL